MPLFEDTLSIKKHWSGLSPRMKVFLVVSSLLNFSSLASLSKTVANIKGFLLDGIQYYELVVLEPLKKALFWLDITVTDLHANIIVITAILTVASFRAFPNFLVVANKTIWAQLAMALLLQEYILFFIILILLLLIFTVRKVCFLRKESLIHVFLEFVISDKCLLAHYKLGGVHYIDWKLLVKLYTPYILLLLFLATVPFIYPDFTKISLLLEEGAQTPFVFLVLYTVIFFTHSAFFTIHFCEILRHRYWYKYPLETDNVKSGIVFLTPILIAVLTLFIVAAINVGLS